MQTETIIKPTFTSGYVDQHATEEQTFFGLPKTGLDPGIRAVYESTEARVQVIKGKNGRLIGHVIYNGMMIEILGYDDETIFVVFKLNDRLLNCQKVDLTRYHDKIDLSEPLEVTMTPDGSKVFIGDIIRVMPEIQNKELVDKLFM